MFCQYIQELSLNDCVNVLTHYLRACARTEGYRALAELMRDGYFSLVLTTGVDSFLEEALIQAGVKQDDMQILLLGRDQPSYIADVLANSTSPLTLLKLYGSLKERVLAEEFPDVLALPPGAGELLGRLLEHDLVVVGDLEHELCLQNLLPVKGKHALYNIYPDCTSTEHTYLTRVLKARQRDPASFMIDGPYGNFHSFFPTLRAFLQAPQTTISEVPPAPAVAPLRLSQATDQIASLQADILLVTATMTEASAVLALHQHERHMHVETGSLYHDLGFIGGARVVLVLQASMGAGGLGGTRFTLQESIQALHPSVIIMVGIACGMKPAQQQPGDILIAERLISYEPQRIGTGQYSAESIIRYRGERVSASARLLGLFKNGALLLDLTGWPRQPRAFFGPILSGDKLLDNTAARETLLQLEPEAIGLEMEGIGLYEVATRWHVEWLLIKAISDWGDGKKADNKEQLQQQAAENAARFTLEILAQGGFQPKEQPFHRAGPETDL
jgi:nucleoside phosphorylase